VRLLLLLLLVLPAAPARAGEALVHDRDGDVVHVGDVEDGERAFFDEVHTRFFSVSVRDYERLPRVWPTALQDFAAASPANLAQAYYLRYGFVADAASPAVPLNLLRKGRRYFANCSTCHAGRVAGDWVVGVPNNALDLQTFSEDVITLLVRDIAPAYPGPKVAFPFWDLRGPKRSAFIASQMPWNYTKGTMNFGFFVMYYLGIRDRSWNLAPGFPDWGDARHVDEEFTPLFHSARKRTVPDGKGRILYAGEGPDIPRTLIFTILLTADNSGARLRRLEPMLADLLAYADSVPAPPYPFAIDAGLAAEGQEVYAARCARCHGTYGEDPVFTSVITPLDEIGTDPGRVLWGPTPAWYRWVLESWAGNHGERDMVDGVPAPGSPDFYVPTGYLAPPLDGVWATAPYLHNGSVPTLRALFTHESKRPAVWTSVDRGGPYNEAEVGLVYDELDPERWAQMQGELDAGSLRAVYDCVDPNRTGTSNGGHRWTWELTEAEATAVIEYLKTL